MAGLGFLLTAVAFLGPLAAADKTMTSTHCSYSNSTIETVYPFSEKELSGSRSLRLSRYAGKELNALQEQYVNDLVILAFPCNQFGQQEPGGNDLEVLNGIRYVRPGNNFQPKMTMFRKIEVNGAREHPLFTYLKKNCPSTRDFFASSTKLDYSPLRVNDIRWNFEKFLINRQGRPVKRYDAAARVLDMRADIELLIASSP